MKESEETLETISKSLQRFVNCLQDENRITRKKGLLDLKKETIERGLGGVVLQKLCNQVLKPVLTCLNDSSEKNRELATELASSYLNVLPSPEDILYHVIVVLVQRLGQKEIIETCEELRLQMLTTILLPSIENVGEKIVEYFSEIIQILQKTILDPFAEVRKTSCKITSIFAKTIPKHFHMQSENLIKPLMLSMTHQHSKVRVAVIEATGDVIQYGNGKNVDDVLSHLAQRFFDPSSQVRMMTTKVIGLWLLKLPDRYSFFHKFIPLILTSCSDEMESIRLEANLLWSKAGQLYEDENEEDLKDKINFPSPKPNLYPKNENRPGLGCRELVHRNLSKLMTAILRDLGDWVVDTRIKTSQLLYHLLLHAETYTTQHMQPLTQALIRACCDDNDLVVEAAVKCSQLIGCFVKPEIFCKILIQAVYSNPSSEAPLNIIASVISGCDDETLGEDLNQIINMLIDVEVCQSSQKAAYHLALLKNVESISKVCHSRIKDIGLELFTVTITCMSLATEEHVVEECEETLKKLACVHAVDVQGLFDLYTKKLLTNLRASDFNWSEDSVDQLVFNCLVTKAGKSLNNLMDEVLPFLKVNLQVEKEPKLKLKLFTILSHLLMKDDWEKKFTKNQIEMIVHEMVAPNLVWKAGRVAAAVRSIAVAALWALLKSGFLSEDPQFTCQLFTNILTPLKCMLEDDNKTTRLTTVKVFRRFLIVCGTNLPLDDVLHKIYMDLIKRMDDSNDEIRKLTARTWLEYFKCMDQNYDEVLYKAHLEEIFSSLLVHMDDNDCELQLIVKTALIEGGKLSSKVLNEEIAKVKHKHRTSSFCDEIIQYFKSMNTNGTELENSSK